jgi:hypothetical protein
MTTRRIGAALAVSAMLGLGGLVMVPASGAMASDAAKSLAGATTDLSAQRNQRRAAPAPRRAAPAARRAAPAPRRAAPAPRRAAPAARRAAPAARRAAPAPRRAAPAPRRAAPAAGRAAPAARRAGPRPGVRPAGVRGPRISARVRGGGALRIGGRRVVVYRRAWRPYWRGRYWNVVPIVALGAFTIGAIAYAPYAYLPVAEPVCEGYTEDGCILRWTEVPTEEGDLVPQCVTYCPPVE